jgi:hypothetical protein
MFPPEVQAHEMVFPMTTGALVTVVNTTRYLIWFHFYHTNLGHPHGLSDRLEKKKRHHPDHPNHASADRVFESQGLLLVPEYNYLSMSWGCYASWSLYLQHTKAGSFQTTIISRQRLHRIDVKISEKAIATLSAYYLNFPSSHGNVLQYMTRWMREGEKT